MSAIAKATLAAIRRFAADTPTVYLPTHDPQSAARLARNSRSPRRTTAA
jgi:glyoxylase-like metal-dependent hydrolase (beta-lactamase superfamily II)